MSSTQIRNKNWPCTDFGIAELIPFIQHLNCTVIRLSKTILSFHYPRSMGIISDLLAPFVPRLEDALTRFGTIMRFGKCKADNRISNQILGGDADRKLTSIPNASHIPLIYKPTFFGVASQDTSKREPQLELALLENSLEPPFCSYCTQITTRKVRHNGWTPQ